MRGIVPSGRAYGLLVGGGAVATLLTNFSDAPGRLGAVLLLLGLFDLTVLVLVLWDGWQVGPQRAQVERSPLPRLSIGRDNPVTLTCQYPGKSQGQSPFHLHIYDAYPLEFAGSAMPLRLVLTDAGPQTVSFKVHPSHRGRYAWGDLRLRQRGPLGLAWADWTVPAATEAVVYPDLIGLNQLSIRLALGGVGRLKQRRLGVGTEFAELREYGTGDDPRLIDWKATARYSSPLVRVLEPEREQPLMILLDRGRLMTAQVQGLTRFDWALNAALSLALAATSRGDQVGVGVFDRGLHTWIPPKGGQSHFLHLVERLAPLQPELIESDYRAALVPTAQKQHRRSLMVVITDLVDATASAELLSALVRLRPRHLPFCVTLRDPRIDQVAHQPSTTVDGAYQRAVALDLLAQREAAFNKLKHSGVLVLDAPAHQITTPLVDAYLRVKARSQL